MDSPAPQQVGTVSIPFIFLKPRGKASARPKKAQFPSSFNGLMKVCQRLFQSYGEVRSIWTTDGELVTNLEEVAPGSTLLVSSLDPNMQRIETKPVSLSKPPRIEPVFSSDSYNRLFGSSQASVTDMDGQALNLGGRGWDDDGTTGGDEHPGKRGRKGSPPDKKMFVSRKASPPKGNESPATGTSELFPGSSKGPSPLKVVRKGSQRDAWRKTPGDSSASSIKSATEQESGPAARKESPPGAGRSNEDGTPTRRRRKQSGRGDSSPGRSGDESSLKGRTSLSGRDGSPPGDAKSGANMSIVLGGRKESPSGDAKSGTSLTLSGRKESPPYGRADGSVSPAGLQGETQESPKHRKRRRKHRNDSPLGQAQQGQDEEGSPRSRSGRRGLEGSPSMGQESSSSLRARKGMQSSSSANRGKNSAILSPSGAKGRFGRDDTSSGSDSDSPRKRSSSPSDRFGSPRSNRSDKYRRSPRDEEDHFDPELLFELVSETIGEGSIDMDVRDSFADSESDVRELLSAAPECERQQKQNWFHMGHQLFAAQTMAVSDSDIYGYDIISNYVQKVIANHRFVSAGGVGYKMQVAIFGPRQSGKSHFLSVFADEIMLEFAMNGHWKKTFFMFMNFRMMTPFINNVAVFYANLVEQMLTSLIWQRPALQPWASRLKSLFLSLPTSKVCPTIPINSLFYQENPQLAPALQRILDRLWDVWNDPEALGPWLTLIFLLPSLVAQAAGFTSIFYFIDNLEFADVDLNGPEPFAETEQSCYVIEFLKFALQRGNFVVTSENQERLEEILARTEAGGTDLFHDLEIVTPINLCKETDDRCIKIDVQGECAPFPLTIDHCCGIPAYVGMWKELNRAFDRNTEGVEDDEYQVLLMTHAQHVLDVIFVIPDSEESLFVTGARR